MKNTQFPYLGRTTSNRLKDKVSELESRIEAIEREVEDEFWKMRNPPMFEVGFENDKLLIVGIKPFLKKNQQIWFVEEKHWIYEVYEKKEKRTVTMIEPYLLGIIIKQDNEKENK